VVGDLAVAILTALAIPLPTRTSDNGDYNAVASSPKSAIDESALLASTRFAGHDLGLILALARPSRHPN